MWSEQIYHRRELAIKTQKDIQAHFLCSYQKQFSNETINNILHSLDWQKLKCHSIPNVSENIKHRNAHTHLERHKLIQPFLENNLTLTNKVKHKHILGLRIPLQHMCTWKMFIAILFIRQKKFYQQWKN